MSSSVDVTTVRPVFDLTRSERPAPSQQAGIAAPARHRPAAPLLVAWSLASQVIESGHRKLHSAIGRIVG